MSTLATFNHRGTTINKIDLFDFQYELESLGFNIYELCAQIGQDGEEIAYVSNGFLAGLREFEDNNDGEWHHYFVKDEEGCFTAGKLKFNNRISTYGL